MHKEPIFRRQRRNKRLDLAKKGDRNGHISSLFSGSKRPRFEKVYQGDWGSGASPNKVVCATKWLANIELAKPLKPTITLETGSVFMLGLVLNTYEENRRWDVERTRDF